MTFTDQNINFMRHALSLAQHAEKQGEVPVGAVLVLDNCIIGEGWNCPIKSQDPTAHAEIMALREAAKKEGNYRLPKTTLYVTLEPCIMCAGAMIHARVERLVFGAYDLRTGAVKSVFHIFDTPELNHQVKYQGGLLMEASGQLLETFFKRRR